ncbi:unnamed protein product [Cunninghamella blakesleeana]
MGDEVGTIENNQLIYRINCDKHYLDGVAPILVLQKDSIKPPLIILEGNNTQPGSKPIIRDERMNKSIGYIIQDNRTLPTQQQPLSPPISSSSAFSPQQQAFYPPPSTTWNQNSPIIPTHHNNSNISSSSSASQDPSFYGNQPFHLISPTTAHHPSPYPQNNYSYQQQPSPLDYNNPYPPPFNHHHHHHDPISPTQQEPFYWNTPKVSSSSLPISPTSSSPSNMNDHWVMPNQYPPQPYPPTYPSNYNHPHHDPSYYPSSPTYQPSDQPYYHHPPPSHSGRQPAFRLIQRPN